MPCDHAAFESSVLVEPRPDYLGVRLRVSVRCAACQAKVVFEDLPVAVEGRFYTVAVSQRGTEVILTGHVALAVPEEAGPWVPAPAPPA